MRIIVTGAAGFIGSWLSEELLARGHEVTGIDCLTDYYAPEIKRRNLKAALQNKNFHFLEQDLLKTNLSKLLNGCSIIFHQAAQAGVRESWGQSFETYTNNNILVTQRLLEASKDSSVERFIYASSSSVYGNATNIPVTEDEPTLPVSPYGVTKLAAENLCLLYHKNYGIPAIALRYFTVFGPRQRPDMAFNKFINAILQKKPIHIFGDGEQTRDFTYIEDAVEANMLAMERGEPGSIYNIGGGARISVNRTIELLESILGKKATRNYSDPQKGDVLHTWADTTRAQTDLGFAPRYDVEKGLKKECEWIVQVQQ